MADESPLTEIVRRAAQVNAKFYKGWMDLSFEYMRGLSEVFGGATSALGSMAPTQEMDAGTGTLVMEGEVGSTVKASFLVSNDLERALSCQFVGSTFTDPSGASISAQMAFEPASLKLAAGEQKVVAVSVKVDERLAPGVGYAGEIAVSGMDGFAVPVVLRRLTTIDENAPDEPVAELSDTVFDRPAGGRASVDARASTGSQGAGRRKSARKRRAK